MTTRRPRNVIAPLVRDGEPECTTQCPAYRPGEIKEGVSCLVRAAPRCAETWEDTQAGDECAPGLRQERDEARAARDESRRKQLALEALATGFEARSLAEARGWGYLYANTCSPAKEG